MTDDLDMGAILNEYGLPDTIRFAIEAGNDLAMICHRVAAIEEVHSILGGIPAAQIDRALESVARIKRNLAAPDRFFRNALPGNRRRNLGLAGGGAWRGRGCASEVPEDGKRSPVETY